LKLDNIIPVEAITSRLWSVFDVLRNEPVSSEDYHLILFLLTIYKDGYLHDAINAKPNDVRYSIEDWIRKSDVEHYHQIIEISGAFNHSLERLSNRALHEIINILFSINIDELKLHFSKIFDNVLYRLAKSQGRYGGEFIQPIELSRLVCNLADLESNSTVYNPFAGVASFGVFLDEGQSYFGQECNYTTWAIGALRLLAYKRPGESKYVKDDSILHWPNDNQKFDLVVSNPPYGLRLVNNYMEVYPKYRTAEQLLIEKGISSLSHKGKLIAILPNGFLFSGSSGQRLRKHLVESDLVDSIIALPGGLLLNTGMPLVILVLNKAKRMPGVVKFIDAKNYVDSKGSREKRLNDYALLSVLNKDQESDSVRIVSINQIRELDYNLSVPRYFQKNFDGVQLNDLGTLIRGNRVHEVQNGKFIRIRDLKDDASVYQLDLDNIEDTEVPTQSQKIEVSCLLLASRWKTLKPTYFKYSGVPIYIRTDILIFIVDESKCDIGYLINELYADYVNEQLESYWVSAVIPMIRREDLLSIKINIPNLEEQRAKIAGIKEAGVKMKLLEAERNALAEGLGNLVYENFASVKHSLGTPLLNIGSSMRNIEKAMCKLDKDWEIMKLSERMDVTLKDSFDSIYSNLELIHSLLKNNEREFEVANYKLEEIDFLKFIRAYFKKIKSVEKINVNINLDINPDLNNAYGKQVLINSNKELLEIALNNIVENANMHAFLDESKKYKLEFRLSLSLEGIQGSKANNIANRILPFLKIEVANNGEPFPENYTLEKFIRKNSFAGKTGNTGIGGHDINEIVKYHNSGVSTLDIVTTDFTTEFVTIYEFTVPIINKNL
jgi:type I restriction enzyme M protein